MGLAFPGNPLHPVARPLIDTPIIIPVVLVGVVFGVRYGYGKLAFRNNSSGQPLAPLGVIVRRFISIAYKEDKYPVIQRPEKLAQRMAWLNWVRYTRILTVVTLVHLFTPSLALVHPNAWYGTTVIILICWYALIKHVRTVVAIRHRTLMQMFEVAASECRYLGGAELNPWGYIQISGWEDLYTPGVTYIMYPPKYRSEDMRAREAFERQFAGAVSDRHTWTFEWESANNRVIATPVPFIPDYVPYPFPDTNPWNILPLGLAAGGEEASVDVSKFPHMLVAGVTGSGKRLSLTTRVPVPVSDRFPTGWATIGQIRVGDTVFDEEGRPAQVFGLSDVTDDPDLFEIEFSDGTVLQADAEHLWSTATRRTTDHGNEIPNVSVGRMNVLRCVLEDARPNDDMAAEEFAGLAGLHVDHAWVQRMCAHVGPVGETHVRVETPAHANAARGVAVLQDYVVHTYNAQQLLAAAINALEQGTSRASESGWDTAVRTTTEIAATLHDENGDARHVVPVAGPLELPDSELPVEPYLFGCMFGQNGADVTRANLFPHATDTSGVLPQYLRSSATQRRAFLAGLLDVTGTVTTDGTIEVKHRDPLITDAVAEVAHTLGYQTTKQVTPNTVAFRCPASPFRLPQKTTKFVQRNTYARERDAFRSIVRITPREPVPARCLQVASPNRLFLVGDTFVPTHNSVTQRNILLHALQSPTWRVILVDPKRVELSMYRSATNVLKVATELEDSVDVIEQVEQEMQSRYLKMQDEGVNNFLDLAEPPPALMLMVDETFALLSPENIKSDEGKERDEMHARCTVLIGSIARLGRAAGVHMILATQRPDAKVIPGETRALALDTPLVTPTGWTTVGDVQPGDLLIDDRGESTTVTGITEVMHDHDCFEIRFSGGHSIVADGGHLWTTNERSSGSTLAPEAQVRTTREIADTALQDGTPNHAIRAVSGAALPHAPKVSGSDDGWWWIESVHPVPPVPVKCVAVDSPTHLFLAGNALIPTHNSNLDARIAQGRMDTTPSLMVLDDDAATRIPDVKGRAVVRAGTKFTEFQAYFLDPDQLPQVLEMSNALARGDITPEDLLGDDEDNEEENTTEGGPVKRLFRKLFGWVKIPHLSLSGLKSRFRRKTSEDELEYLAGQDDDDGYSSGLSPRFVDSDYDDDDADDRGDGFEYELDDLEHFGGPDGMPSVDEIAAAARARGVTSESTGLFDDVLVPDADETAELYGVSVGDVLRLAAQRGAPVPASELVTALRNEADAIPVDEEEENNSGRVDHTDDEEGIGERYVPAWSNPENSAGMPSGVNTIRPAGDQLDDRYSEGAAEVEDFFVAQPGAPMNTLDISPDPVSEIVRMGDVETLWSMDEIAGQTMLVDLVAYHRASGVPIPSPQGPFADEINAAIAQLFSAPEPVLGRPEPTAPVSPTGGPQRPAGPRRPNRPARPSTGPETPPDSLPEAPTGVPPVRVRRRGVVPPPPPVDMP